MGDVNSYVRKFAKPMTLNQWKKQYANLYTSWFGNSEEVAKGWITTFGPLGFRSPRFGTPPGRTRTSAASSPRPCWIPTGNPWRTSTRSPR